MTPHDFLTKWRHAELKERSASQSHFNDLCVLLGVVDPVSADPKGEWFTFEKGASKTSGGEGWADVWRKGCFAWEYKGRRKDLKAAFNQLLQYSVALENPPLLIVSDMDRIRIHTNWTNTVQEVHEFATEDLLDGSVRDRLKAAFTDPEEFRPVKTRQALTEETAAEFAGLAQRLRERGHEAHQVAHFINRLVFCMFAEDVGLLPDHLFTRMLRASHIRPERFERNARKLFAAMAEGGDIDFTPIDWFNGGLFDDDHALPVTSDDIGQLLQAAGRDWSQIDPSILGTLFERGLDPAKRSQLGAHYTDREKIMMIVRPTIIEPLEAEWAEALAKMTVLIEKAPQQTKDKLLRGADLAKRTRALTEAEAVHNAFIERLANFRVLDPACGSGNFLYVALKTLKDIEHLANLDAEALGLPRGFPRVGPESVLGIELNPYAAELARVSVWIGEIQWMRRNGFAAAKNPILRPLDTIERRDALLNEDGTRAEWPDADVVIGNPPFLGAKWMLESLGDEYTEQLRGLLTAGSPASDLVTFWFHQAARSVDRGVQRVGFVSTNMVRSPANASVASGLYLKAPIIFALSDEPWVVDGADVRVSLIVCSTARVESATLDGELVTRVTPDLKGLSIDLGERRVLAENIKRAVRGIEKGGPFEIDRATAQQFLRMPLNPNGRSNVEVVKRYATVAELVGRGKDEWIVDFSGLDLDEASLFEAPFAWVESAVRAKRVANREPRQSKNWWLFRRSGEQARAVLRGKQRVLSTGLVTKHRVFRWLDATMIPDTRVILIDSDTDVMFGLLSSSVHEKWALATCQFHGVGNDPVYTPGDCFDTFPFPEGLTPDTPAAEYADDPRAQAIAVAAARLNELRENWLNPADLVVREPEVVPGYPDRILPKDDQAAKELKKRTLTILYNQRPQWLANAHAAVDQAVAHAYGWGNEWRGGKLTDHEILARLFRLNQQRASATWS
ncbi:MAG: N-6 DNA methylase [Pseudomonadota bacterium]|nr:N-6 DNA methylase [Pseudomonadota bacterium]